MIVPFIFWLVSYSCLWIKIFKSSLMRITGINKVWFYISKLLNFIFLMLMMYSFDIIAFSVKSCRTKSLIKSRLLIFNISDLENRLMNKSRYVPLFYLIGITRTISTALTFHSFPYKINKINFILKSFFESFIFIKKFNN